MTERALTVNFLGNTAGLEAALKRASTQLNGFQAAGARLQGVGKSMTRNLTLPIIGFTAAAATAAVKFQQSMEQLHTQAGVGQRSVGQLSKGILDMAGSVGTGPQKLAEGMYHVASSLNATLAPAKRTSTELNVLRIAAEGAQVGNANLVDVTNALDAAVVSGIKGVQNYSQAMGALNAIVGAGDMTMQDLADALSTGLLAPMKTYGLTLRDVGGALATFGDNNIRGQEAATKLISAVRIMAAPSKAAAKELGGIGLSTTQLADDMRKGGLVGALTDLQKHLKDSGLTASQQGLVISRAFGGRQSTGVQVLLHQLDRLKAKTEEVGKGAQGFSDAWASFQKTAAFQVHQGLASMQADLTRFGNDVLPTLLKIGGQVLKGVDTVAHAFTSLPKGAQDAIIKGGLVLAAIGPAMRLLGVFTGGLGRLWALAQKIQAWGAVTQTAAGKTPLSTAAGKQLTASVGTMEVATLVARSMVAGGVGGAGGVSGVGGTAAKDTAKAESGIAKVETGIAGGGLLANIKSGIGKVASGALKGVAIAGIGTLMSQAIGQSIHGAVGKAISTIGTDGSIGAGIGAVFGPPGIIPGALLGGLVGAFRTFIKNPSGGEKISAKIFSGGFGGKQAPGLAAATASALDELRKFTVPARTGSAGRGRGPNLKGSAFGDAPHLNITGLSPQDAAKAMAAANKAGMLVAKQLEAGWNQYRFQSEPIMFAQFTSKFKQLPPEAQAKGADLAIKFAAGLERAGRLPAGATDRMIRDIEQRFPGLWRFIGLSARDGAAQFYKAMDLSKTQARVSSQLHAISRDFPQVQQAMASTNGTIGAKSAAAVAALKRLAQGTGAMAATARRDLNRLRSSTDSTLSATVALVNSKAKAMANAIGRGIPSAARAVVANFDALQSKIGRAMAASTISVQRAAKLIGSALNAMLATENAALSPRSLAQWEKFWQTGATFRQTSPLGHRNERGSMWQFGRAGDRGKDMIPVNFGGRQIVVGSGEVGMVLTGDQQAVLNERTQDLGGLPGVFAKHDRPHSMGQRPPGFAQGGAATETRLQTRSVPSTSRTSVLREAAAPLYHRAARGMPPVVAAVSPDRERGMIPGFASGGLPNPAILTKKPTSLETSRFYALAHKIWGALAGAGALPGGAHFPSFTLAPYQRIQKQLPGAVAYTLGHRIHLPWGVVHQALGEWTPYGESYSLETLVHEMAHTMQSPKTLSSVPMREGGAEAWAHERGDQVLRKVFGKYSYVGASPQYRGYAKQVLKTKGLDWVNRGQFASGGQVNVSAGQMGLVLTGDQQTLLNNRTADLGGLPGMISGRLQGVTASFASGGSVGSAVKVGDGNKRRVRRFVSGGIVRGFARGGTAPENKLQPIISAAKPAMGDSTRPRPREYVRGGLVRGLAKFATGGMISGVDPTTHRKTKHTQVEWVKIWSTYSRNLIARNRVPTVTDAQRQPVSGTGDMPVPTGARPESPSGSSPSSSGPGSSPGRSGPGGPVTWGIDPRTHQHVRHSRSDWGKIWEGYRGGFASIPSQDTGRQIKMTLLANELTVAQNKNDTAGQQKALAAEAKLGQSWLVADQKKLQQIKVKLHDKSISRGFHAALLADELALLQEIGTVQSNIGTANTSLGDGGTGGSGSSSQFDLMPGSIKLPTVYDVHRAVAGTIAAQPRGRDRIPTLTGAHRQPGSHFPTPTGERRQKVSHHISHHIPVYDGDRRVPVPTGERSEPSSHHTHHHASPHITVHVHDKRDVDDVADAIDRATNSRLHARLRAQGLRGT